MATRTRTYWLIGTLLVISLFLGYRPGFAQSPVETQVPQQPVVQAVLFWMDTCGHCQYVFKEILPPLQVQFGEQFQIILVQLVTTEDVDRLYRTATALGISKADVWVPFLVIGDQVLIGYRQISEKLPVLIEQYLAQGGANVSEVLSDLLPTPEAKKVTIYFFWGDGCPHCAVAKPALQNLAQRYPNVEIKEYEVWYVLENQTIFKNMAAAFGFEPRYVPTIFIGDHYWEGYSEALEAEIESAIQNCLERGCSDPGLSIEPLSVQTIAPADPTASPLPRKQSVESKTAVPMDPRPSVTAQMRSNGFTLAVIVMSGMMIALIYTGLFFWQGFQDDKILLPSDSQDNWRNVWIPIFCLIGLGVASYLTYVETQMLPAVCGPVGDCNAVQSSSYAWLFGILPIGVLGIIGYLAILIAWGLSKRRYTRLSNYAMLVLFSMTVFGVIFSLYLTYLEPFVIKAVCMWCVLSAVIMTLLMLLSLKPALRAIRNLREGE